MYKIIWRFIPKPGREKEFEAEYSSGGRWDSLFRQAPGYERTELLHDLADPRSYLTIDSWQTKDAFDAFKAEFQEPYDDLDRLFENLTMSEIKIGTFESV